MSISIRRRIDWAVVLAGLALSGCQPEEARAPADNPAVFSGLGGTAWQLVEVQSMDDSQGAMRPSDSSKYTIAFNPDGSAALRLDCNRGAGPWRNDVANATGGSLAIGPFAVTKALCPEPTMGELLERQLGFVRTFTVWDGRLNMALMADGGIIVWRPLDGAQ